jgi:hypothetical protein
LYPLKTVVFFFCLKCTIEWAGPLWSFQHLHFSSAMLLWKLNACLLISRWSCSFKKQCFRPTLTQHIIYPKSPNKTASICLYLLYLYTTHNTKVLIFDYFQLRILYLFKFHTYSKRQPKNMYTGVLCMYCCTVHNKKNTENTVEFSFYFYIQFRPIFPYSSCLITLLYMWKKKIYRAFHLKLITTLYHTSYNKQSLRYKKKLQR